MSKVIKNSLYYTLANIIPQFVGFLFLPIYSVYMSTSDFGIVSAMETLTYIFSIIACFSIDRAAQRFYFDTREQDKQKKMLSTLFVSTIIFSIAFIFIGLLLKPLLQPVFSSIEFYPYFVFCILTVSLNNLSLITSNFYQISEQPKKYMYLKITRLLSKIIFTMVFVVVLMDGAKGQLKAEFFSAFLFMPIYIYIAHRNFGWRFDFIVLKDALKFSWPFIPTLLVSWVLTLSDRVFLDKYSGLVNLGIYSMGYKISMAVFIVSSAFAMAYTPIFYKLANKTNQNESKEKIFLYSWYASIFFILIMFVFSLFTKELVEVMLDQEYHDSYSVIRIILIAHLFSAITSITSGLYIMQAKLTKLNMIVSLKVAVLNVILNYLFIPDYGIYGAAWATVLSMIVLAILMYRGSRQGYFVPVPWMRISLILVVVLTVVAFYHFYLEQFSSAATISKLMLLLCFVIFVYCKRLYLMDFIYKK